MFDREQPFMIIRRQRRISQNYEKSNLLNLKHKFKRWIAKMTYLYLYISMSFSSCILGHLYKILKSNYI